MSELAESLLSQLLEEQRRTNQLLEQMAKQQLMLIEAMAEDAAPDMPPITYMDGSKVR
ncbi:hypothetical protein [Azotobacter chroococcum]|uniref:Uncharacterized protein n=1 Tax=Azotobacter chroococcum TaxID=353 RepID=A0AAP9YHT5_9GAMM|nr:hypothetical protein [Azotobacter chroococcum]QQE90472.1 hypothetical protein GKQ51_09445 [Azotobacter chroococcum]